MTRLPFIVSRICMRVFIALLMPLLLAAVASGAEAFRFDRRHEVIGAMGTYAIKDDESLYELARYYKTGYNEIVAANPGVDPVVPEEGASIVLPTSWILPDAARERGIVVNLSELRLYYYFKRHGRNFVKTYPVGIGEEGAETPLGVFRVVEKIPHPSWRVPASIRREKPELPAVMPPGPDNPMGAYALRLSRRTVLIHGTDVPWGIGSRVSHGCIRLYPEDIAELFELVSPRTRVIIVQQPVKVGVLNGRVYVEVNEDADLKKSYDYRGAAANLLRKRCLSGKVNARKLARAVREKRGFPVDITRSK